jgi:hypothetical protein
MVMPKVVANCCYGGFGISDAAIRRYCEIKGINLVRITSTYGEGDDTWSSDHYAIDGIDDDEHYFYYGDIKRDDPALVQVVEEMGSDAHGEYARLRIADVPDGVKWYIDDYDGIETIREEHRTW